MTRRVTRRVFLGGSLAAVVVACSSSDGDGDPADPAGDGPDGPSGVELAEAPRSPFEVDPFTLGVASGDPTADSLVIWTRLAPDPLTGDGGAGADAVELAFDVALDDAFEQLVASGTVTAEPALGHSVHIELEGLAPGTVHHYRFRLGDATSPTGRGRTAPEPGSDEPFSFVFGSCQDYEDGFWAAHRHLVDEAPDLVVWLGDYIYEGEGSDEVPEGKVRAHFGPEPRTVEQYRTRYAQYRLEPELQAAHAVAAWAVTWDDHEVANNHAGDISDGDEAPDAFRARRAAAYQAWYEHQPVRLPPPDGSTYPIARTVAIGDLVAFHLIDGRQFRSDQVCSDDGDIGPRCPEVDDPARTMLGSDQEAWLDRAYLESTAAWDVLANQTILSPAEIRVGPISALNLDQWDGYAAARRRVYDTLARADNPVVITGDVHSSIVADMTSDPDDPTSDIFASELVGTAISSTFPAEFVSIFESAVEASPLARFADAERRGYVRCDVDRQTLRAAYRLLADVTDPDSTIETAVTFEITAGTPGVREV